MSTTTNKTEKSVNVKNVETKKDFLNILDSVNFDKLEKKVQIKSKIEEKKSATKKRIYKNYENLTDKERKSKRTKLRRQRTNFENDILKFYKENNNKELKETLKNFLEFYKENYILNDFSIYSLIENNTDTEKMKKTEETLNVIKEILKIK